MCKSSILVIISSLVFSSFALATIEDASVIATIIKNKNEDIRSGLQENTPNCAQPLELEAHLNALKAFGEFESCKNLIDTCELNQDTWRSKFVGANCILKDSKNIVVYDSYKALLKSKYQNREEYKAAVIRVALYARGTEFADEVPSLLSRISQNDDELAFYNEVIEYLYLQVTNGDEDLLKSYIVELLKTSDSLITPAIANSWMRLLSRNRKHEEVKEFILTNQDKLGDPNKWYTTAYQAFYYLGSIGFSAANEIYQAQLDYLNPHSTYLVELNTYDYTEIYNEVCADNLLQGSEAREFNNLKRLFVNGGDRDDILSDALVLKSKYRDKSDLLTFIGYLFQMDDQLEEAQNHYFMAHNACPNYHRSHWGLNTVARKLNQRRFDDYEELKEESETISEQLQFPKEVETYILNWKTFNQDEQRRILYALRYWKNHIKMILDSNRYLYIKHVYQLLSESPELGRIRDQRITYEGDHRLWDDVRGLGGRVTVSDYMETAGSPYGEYNLGAHEVAHQFQFAAPSHIDLCIKRLYRQAKDQDTFPDSYAARNDKEYFAQGVTYYQYKENAPARFGINKQWIENNDPDLLKFIVDIETQASVSEISCPI